MRKLALWGYHLDEYKAMFALPASALPPSILEYGCGPTAVNYELSQLKHKIISCDSLFNLDKETLATKVKLIFADVEAKLRQDKDKFDFSAYGSLELLLDERREGLAQFFADFSPGLQEKRYLGLSNNQLPFQDFSFDLALSSHYLFADLEGQDLVFHLQAIRELARVAKEVRIFPLIDRNNEPSPFLGPLLLALQQENYGVEIKEANYYLQKGANALLRVFAKQCAV